MLASEYHDDAISRTWDTVERLANELSDLAQQPLPPDSFHAALLSRATGALAAHAAVLWTQERNEFAMRHQVHVAGTPVEPLLSQPGHRGLLNAVWRSHELQLVLPRTTAAGGTLVNPTDWLVLVGPVRVEAQTVCVIELLLTPTTHPQAQDACRAVLAALCEAAADFHRNHELRTLRAERSFWEQADSFSRRVHGALGVQATAFAIVNESRRLLDCDRVTVALRRGAWCVTLAVSGVERVQRRSATIRRLERLAAVTAATGETLDYDGSEQQLPPQVAGLLQPYVDESHVRQLTLLPLAADADEPPESRLAPTRDQPPVGVLVVERFDGCAPADAARRLAVLRRPAAVALSNALRHRHRWRRAWDWLAQARNGAKVAVGVLLLAAVLAAAALIPADFAIEARGELLPTERYEVFAPDDGEIETVLFERNKPVGKHDVLVRLHSAALDLERTRLLGEERVTAEKLAAAIGERTHGGRTSADDRRKAADTAANQNELEVQLKGLRQQIEQLDRQLDRLKVLSPSTGQVITWDAEQLLAKRPVTRGQTLLTVANVDGEWELLVRIPDHHLSHVRAAQEESGAGLEVSFILRTEPEARYRGRLRNVGLRTETDRHGEAFVKAEVAFPRDEVPALRAGAAAMARIHCGRASLGYVWLHDLIDAGRTWLFF